MNSLLSPLRGSAYLLTTLAAALALSGCANPFAKEKVASAYQHETFATNENFSRLIDDSAPNACEAARLALLSQGYIITAAKPEAVNGSKSFQPDGDTHLEIGFTIVCVPDGKDPQISTMYVSAQQDRYAVKKSAVSTSLGVSAIGSISLPMSSSQDSMVKVASETILAPDFYTRFFSLTEQKLKEAANPP